MKRIFSFLLLCALLCTGGASFVGCSSGADSRSTTNYQNYTTSPTTKTTAPATTQAPKNLATAVYFPEDTLYLGIGESATLALIYAPAVLDDYSGDVFVSNTSVVSATYSANIKAEVTFTGKSAGSTNVKVTLAGGKSAMINVIVLDPREMIILNFPSLPQTISDGWAENSDTSPIYGKGQVTNMTWTYKLIDATTVDIAITITGKKTYDFHGDTSTYPLRFYLEFYNNKGQFQAKYLQSVRGLTVNQNFSVTQEVRLTNIDPERGCEFILKLSDYLV